MGCLNGCFVFFCSDKEGLLPEEQSSVESLTTPDSPTKADKAWGLCQRPPWTQKDCRDAPPQNWQNVVLLIFIITWLKRSPQEVVVFNLRNNMWFWWFAVAYLQHGSLWKIYILIFSYQQVSNYVHIQPLIQQLITFRCHSHRKMMFA